MKGASERQVCRGVDGLECSNISTEGAWAMDDAGGTLLGVRVVGCAGRSTRAGGDVADLAEESLSLRRAGRSILCREITHFGRGGRFSW